MVWLRFRMLTVGERGFMGVAGREWVRYHANTTIQRQQMLQNGENGVASVLLWPNLLGSEDAPATAKRGFEKNILSAASISASRL